MAQPIKPDILHHGLVPATLALGLVLADATPGETESVPLEHAAGRVLAGDLAAMRTQPPFPASAMDGYAVRHADLETVPSDLPIAGEAAAGHPFTGPLPDGACVRIFTGAPVPDGLDTVIIQENTEREGDRVRILKEAPKGNSVRVAGVDFNEGDRLLSAGTMLDPQALALAAAMNHAELPVWRKPSVAVLATGDELVLPGEKLSDGQILASNSYAITAIAAEAGGEASNLGIARDTLDDLLARIGGALDEGADLVVTTGGASVGDHDLVMPALAQLGFTFAFAKVAIRPGKPVMFARATIGGRERRFLGLPGNPVSSIVTAYMFMRPLIASLAGRPPQTFRRVPALLEHGLPANGEREDYMRARARRDDEGVLHVTAFSRQDSSMLSTLSQSDCLLIRPVGAVEAQQGDTVPVVLLRDV